jgi:hypothetical protein
VITLPQQSSLRTRLRYEKYKGYSEEKQEEHQDTRCRAL